MKTFPGDDAILAERLKFEEWLRAVDAEMEALVGCTAADLADCPYWDWWKAGKKPKAAAKAAAKRNGFGG